MTGLSYSQRAALREYIQSPNQDTIADLVERCATDEMVEELGGLLARQAEELAAMYAADNVEYGVWCSALGEWAADPTGRHFITLDKNMAIEKAGRRLAAEVRRYPSGEKL